MLLPRWALLAAICVAALAATTVATSETDEELYLQSRVDQLESELSQLRELLKDVLDEDTPMAQPDTPGPGVPAEPYTVQMPVRAFPQAHERELSGSGTGSTPALTFQVRRDAKGALTLLSVFRGDAGVARLPPSRGC
jgi:hypothetical protein